VSDLGSLLATFLLGIPLGVLIFWVSHRPKPPPPQWVDIPGDPLTLAHREMLAEVMRRKLAGTLAALDRPDVDRIFLRAKEETAPKSDTPPREARRLITSLSLRGRGAPDEPKLILTGREEER